MPELGRTAASLRIFGADLDPDAVSRLLGADPTACARNGDTRRTTSGREITARFGSWLLAADAASSPDLNAQISAILTKLTNDLSVWRDLTRRYQCDIFCGLFMREGNEGAELEPTVLAMVGDRGLRLGLDIYGPPD